MTTENGRPSEAPKDGFEWALIRNAKGKGYIEALIDMGRSEAEAEAEAEKKYPSEWKQRKIASTDKKANIQMALTGLVSYAKGCERLDINPVGAIEEALYKLGLQENWAYQPNPLKDGGIQYYEGKPVMRWLPDGHPFDANQMAFRLDNRALEENKA